MCDTVLLMEGILDGRREARSKHSGHTFRVVRSLGLAVAAAMWVVSINGADYRSELPDRSALTQDINLPAWLPVESKAIYAPDLEIQMQAYMARLSPQMLDVLRSGGYRIVVEANQEAVREGYRQLLKDTGQKDTHINPVGYFSSIEKKLYSISFLIGLMS
jgi:hypothetical protein